MPATIRDLREFRARDLEVLLQAEEREWSERLNWDFRSSSDLVRKFVDSNSLNGFVLVNGAGLPTGYTYFVFEEGKGLLGDLYVMPEYRSALHEGLLMNFALNQIAEAGGVPRVESQILMLSSTLQRPDRGWRGFEVLERAFMTLQLPLPPAMEARTLPANIAFEPWTNAHQEQAAHLIPTTYQGHVDSRINDQYRTLAGARKFLHNIVQYPGCGEFAEAASFAAFNRTNGDMCGMVLSSMVSADSGHITQVCVLPDFQRIGLGRELLQQAIKILERKCRSVSLTVTQENRGARMLYERLGFRTVKKFGAYVWTP